MASAPPRPGPARNSQAACSAVDLDSRAEHFSVRPSLQEPSDCVSYRTGAGATSPSPKGGLRGTRSNSWICVE